MSTVSTTGLYDEDLSGTNPNNLVTGEVQTLQVPGPTDYYFIIPKAAPFFVDSLKVYNHLTGAEYVEGEDYMVGHRFIEAMDSIGRPIAGSIRFMKRSIVGQARLTYRTIGGQWGFSDQAILAELSRRQYNPLIRAWAQIDTLPATFPPYEHDQSIDSLVGSEEINESLKRLGDIMEATASGTTESHLRDFDNPHRVTKDQVLLGNVPNFAMATDNQHIQANRNDLFTNPRGVLLAIQEYALKPLTAHANSTGNVHGLVASDINLGNVPNFPKASPSQAIDPTNDTTLMTPYTVSLLMQATEGDPRLDQLIIDFNNHLAAVNPHGITPAMIGTLTEQEIRTLIQAGGGGSGGDASLFDGQTPEEWEAKFPAVADINNILKEEADAFQDGINGSADISFSDPRTPEEIDLEETRKIQGVLAGYAAYGVFNSRGDVHIVAATEAQQVYPVTPVNGSVWTWLSLKDANYYVAPGNGIRAAGISAMTIPSGWAAGAGFNPANQVMSMWGSKTALFVQLEDDRVFRISGGTAQLMYAGAELVTDMFVGTELEDSRQKIIVQKTPEDGPMTYTAVGAPEWVSAMNIPLAVVQAGGWQIEDIRIGHKYLIFLVSDTSGASPNKLRIYEMNLGTAITTVEVTSTLDVYSTATRSVVKANTLQNVTGISGNYDHHIITIDRDPMDPNSLEVDIAVFGNDDNAQLEIPNESAPFLQAAAGYGFSVTISSDNYAEFWGDSPDNAMIYTNGTSIVI